MKRNEATVAAARTAMPGRLLLLKKSLGMRSWIFVCFLLFTALLLGLLWLMQIVFLDDFYRMQKTSMLKSSSESIVRNIDNENLQALVERIAEENGMCVLVMDAGMRELASCEMSPGCVVHHIGRRELKCIAGSLRQSAQPRVMEFPMEGFRNRDYDERKFLGRVPPSDNGEASSMVTVQRATLANGGAVYVFLNTVVTPVSATVQTIRNELYLISAVLVLLSFLMSLVLSRRIARPLVETTVAAAGLSQGSYTPVENAGYREIDQLNAQLIQTAKDLKRVEEMQRELIANISHDLRTPLTLIEGYAEVMRDLPGENTPENMQVIIDETKRLSTLVSAVLELNNAKHAENNLQKKRFNLTECIRGIMGRYAKLTQQDGYHIVFEPQRDVWVVGDEVKVQQVIYNLINNALTYTGEDHTVRVTQRVEQNRARIAVCDSGEGIAPEDLPYIWDRYYRGSKPHKRPAIGSGLGLSIVKGILDGHGLSYGVDSAQGKGSVFWFEMPEAETEA